MFFFAASLTSFHIQNTDLNNEYWAQLAAGKKVMLPSCQCGPLSMAFKPLCSCDATPGLTLNTDPHIKLSRILTSYLIPNTSRKADPNKNFNVIQAVRSDHTGELHNSPKSSFNQPWVFNLLLLLHHRATEPSEERALCCQDQKNFTIWVSFELTGWVVE